MNNELMFSSKNKNFDTPQWLYRKLSTEFFFNLDVCASHDNTKCISYLSEKQDALSFDWSSFKHLNGICWMNPPYGRSIGKWMKKAYQESLKGCTVVCLVPARTDTNWWWKWVLNAKEIRFLKGRLIFGSDAYWSWIWDQEYLPDSKGVLKKNTLFKQYGKKNSAPFPSAIVVFNNELKQFAKPNITWCDWRGEIQA